MSEEMRNEMIEETVEVEVYDYDESEVEGRRSIKGVVIGVGSVAITGATALAIKNRDKIKEKLEERKIKKLEAKGYEIIRPELPDEIDGSDSNDVESEK